MNGRTAKALRQQVYGDLSQKIERHYLRSPKGTIINDPRSLRAQYQAAKWTAKKDQP